MPKAHPLAGVERLSLDDLAREPLVSYHPSFTGRTAIDRAFTTHRLEPQFVLEAIDADVIKTYVRGGLGVGLVAEVAMREENPDGDLAWRPVGHLFGHNVARVAFKRGVMLRSYVFAFAELLGDRLSRPLIERALGGQASTAYEL
jgi:LysR family cys regulon transcriptional activator